MTLILDSQSVKGPETVSRATRGFDAGKKMNVRKRHLVVDTKGLPTAGIPRSPAGLIILKVSTITLALPWPEPRP